MKRLVLVLALLPGIAVGDEIAAGDCAPVGLDASLLTHGGDVLPADGGVLVGWQRAGDWQSTHEGDPADHPEWRFKVGKKSIKPKRTQLAPGLVRYDVPTKVKRTKRGTKVKLAELPVFVARKKAKSPKFRAAAPVVTAVATTTYRGRREERTIVTAVLDAAPPDDAYGLIVYEDGHAVSWVAVFGSAMSRFEIYESPGGCALNPPGMRAPLIGGEVTFAWVDSYGRLSPRSSSVTVQ
jgi:hypothetical protein